MESNFNINYLPCSFSSTDVLCGIYMMLVYHYQKGIASNIFDKTKELNNTKILSIILVFYN